MKGFLIKLCNRIKQKNISLNKSDQGKILFVSTFPVQPFVNPALIKYFLEEKWRNTMNDEDYLN